jgi:hypothetical protein
VAIAPGPPLTAGSPTPLFEARSLLGPRASLGLRAQYDVSADGGRFLVNLEETEQQTRFFTLLNWQRLVQDGLGSAKAQ